MLLLIWVYAGVLVCCAAWVPSQSLISKSKSVWKPQRINSKMSRDFDDKKITGKQQWNERLRKIHETKNSSEDLNEIPDELHPKIVNGRPAAEGEFPWMVALHFNGRFICSSFLISPTIVMTAAHCVEFENGVEPASAFYGIAGNVRRAGPDTRLEFREVAAHPDYGSGSEGDIAILRTSAPVQMAEGLQAICLPTAGREFDLVYMQAMGWGAQSSEMPEAPEVLMTTELGTLTKSACRFFFALLGITITDRHICSNSFRPTGVCFGDSGGPGVYDDASTGRKVAVGVASFITFLGCGRPLVPSVYTRIASYVDWLTQTAGDNSDICFV